MSDETDPPRWDADDPRRQRDCFAPPAVPCECACMHCNRVFSSDAIWFQRVVNGGDDGLDGFWMCPTNNCGGAGFTFDIFPIDPAHPANAGWITTDDDEDDDGPPSEFDAEGEFVPPADREWSEDADDEDEEDDDADAWKAGLTPEQAEAREAERRAAWAEWEAKAAAEEAERQADFDRPDRRPREIDGRELKRPAAEPGMDDVPF